MNDLRRVFSCTVFLLALLSLFAGYGRTKAVSTRAYRAYVGTYTAKTDSKGIYEFRFASATGKMSAVEIAAESKDPSWVVTHPNGKYLYAANEAGKASTVSAFAIEPKTGKLTLLNQVPALGEDPCYLSFDRTAKFLFVDNYTSGNVVVFPILKDGRIGEHTSAQKDAGTPGPNKERQEAPHAHWSAEHLNTLLVADLGLDRVLVYRFDPSEGTLGPIPEASPKSIRPPGPIALSPGTGPRHIAISSAPNRNHMRFMYILGELDSSVTVVGTTKEGDFAGRVQTVAMLPAGFSGRNDAAEIEIHPSGKFLYASNRGKDSIVVYAIDANSGKLTQVEDVATGGKEPRHFAIDPGGNFLLAENQLSDTIVEFAIDAATGKLKPTGETLHVASPVCITFLPVE